MDKETGERREEEIEIKKRVGRTAKENEKGGGSIPLPSSSSSSRRNGTASLKEFIHTYVNISWYLSVGRDTRSCPYKKSQSSIYAIDLLRLT